MRVTPPALAPEPPSSCLMWETEEKPASSSCAFSSRSSCSARSCRSGAVLLSVPPFSLGARGLL